MGARYVTHDLGRYSSRCSFHKKLHTLIVTAPLRWRKRVAAHNLGAVDGIVTLDAAKLASQGEVELFAATWLEQSRGHSVRILYGYIARHGNVCYHGTSIRQVTEGIKRKVACVNNPSNRVGA